MKIRTHKLYCVLILILRMGNIAQAGNPLESFEVLQKKLTSGKSVTVAYLGGSITAGAMTSPTKGVAINGPYDYSRRRDESWRKLTFAWFKKTYPQAKLTMIHAAVGGTGSTYGAYRLEEHVLKHNPDMLFIEFTVNDMGKGLLTERNPKADNSIYRTLTSIISRARAQNPSIAILIPLTTIRPDEGQEMPTDSNYLASRRHHTAAAAMWQVPSVDLTEACWQAPLPAGVERARIFDGPRNPGNRVHPSPHGHRAYAAAVIATLTNIFNRQYQLPEASAKTFKPFPVRPKIILPQDLPSAWGWSVGKQYETRFDVYSKTPGYIASPDADPMVLKFTGSHVALAWVYAFKEGGPLGRAEALVDGKLIKKIVAGKRKQGESPVQRYCEIVGGLNPHKVHTLEIRIPTGQKEVRLALHAICIDEG